MATAVYRYPHFSRELLMEHMSFHEFPAPGDELADFDLPITDGGRMRRGDHLGYAGLAEELNRHAKTFGVAPSNVGLTRAFCWINIAAIIPILGLFIALANIVIFPMMLHDLTSYATRILRARADVAGAERTRRDLVRVDALAGAGGESVPA